MFSGRCDGVMLFPVNHQRLGVTRRRPERGCLEAGGWWWPHVLVAGVGSSELSRRGAAHTPTTRPRGGGFGSYSGGRRVSLPFDCQTPTPTSDPTRPLPPASPRPDAPRRSPRSEPTAPFTQKSSECASWLCSLTALQGAVAGARALAHGVRPWSTRAVPKHGRE